MPHDIADKLIDLTFVIVPAIVFIGLFFLLEKRRKKS